MAMTSTYGSTYSPVYGDYLVISDLVQTQIIGSTTITQVHQLTIPNLAQTQSLDSVTISGDFLATTGISVIQAEIPIEATVIAASLDQTVSILLAGVTESAMVEAVVTSSADVQTGVTVDSGIEATVIQSDQLEASLL